MGTTTMSFANKAAVVLAAVALSAVHAPFQVSSRGQE